MENIEKLANEYAQGVIKHNPDYQNAEGVITTAVVFGAQQVERPWENSDDCFNFGAAINALKCGLKVRREGWNGKGMFLWLKPETKVKAEWCHDPMLKVIAENNGGEIPALSTICMYTANGEILTGWLASQTDMLSEDWEIVK